MPQLCSLMYRPRKGIFSSQPRTPDFRKPSTHIRHYLSSDTTHTLTLRLQSWAGQKCWWWSCQASRRCLGCVLSCIGHAKAFSVHHPELLIFEKPWTYKLWSSKRLNPYFDTPPPLIFENRRHIYVAIFLATQPILWTAALSFELCRSVDDGLVEPLEGVSVVFFDV